MTGPLELIEVVAGIAALEEMLGEALLEDSTLLEDALADEVLADDTLLEVKLADEALDDSGFEALEEVMMVEYSEDGNGALEVMPTDGALDDCGFKALEDDITLEDVSGSGGGMLELSTFDVDTATEDEIVTDSLFEDGTGDDEDDGTILDSLLEVVMTTVEVERTDEEATDEDSTLLEIDKIAELDAEDADDTEGDAAEELGWTAEALLEGGAADEDHPP